ncbi:MAG: 3-phosphoserine/phosphohydroxythreonine transaminase [Planctomycetota bacterium]
MTQQRVYNFSAGPAVLPLPVLEQAREELLSFGDAGASVLEISHRSAQFASILADAKQRITDLLSVPDSHEVLFLQGGSRLQFSMIPMNFLRGASSADYIVTGSWTKKAVDEAKKEGNVNIAWDGKDGNYNRRPSSDELKLGAESAYVYYTSNETIQGVQFLDEPAVGEVPLICDASSDFMCRDLPIEKYAMVYACAQKNAGPAGVTVVIVRKDLLGKGADDLPGYCNYKSHSDAGSMFNTPPTFGIYMVGLVAKWLQGEGGLSAIEKRNRDKSGSLYEVIDGGDFYTGHAETDSRSIMNVTFTLPSDELQDKFVSQAAERNLCNLKGHRSVGGIRASIYNAMPVEGVTALRDFMVEFRDQNS